MRQPPDYRDLALRDSALDFVLQAERLCDLERDLQAYRALALAAVAEVATLTRTVAREREQHHRVLDQYRHLRQQIMSQGVAA